MQMWRSERQMQMSQLAHRTLKWLLVGEVRQMRRLAPVGCRTQYCQTQVPQLVPVLVHQMPTEL